MSVLKMMRCRQRPRRGWPLNCEDTHRLAVVVDTHLEPPLPKALFGALKGHFLVTGLPCFGWIRSESDLLLTNSAGLSCHGLHQPLLCDRPLNPGRLQCVISVALSGSAMASRKNHQIQALLSILGIRAILKLGLQLLSYLLPERFLHKHGYT